MAFRMFFKYHPHMGQVPHKRLVTVFTIFLSTQIKCGKHWNQLRKGNKQTTGFLMTLLDCIFSEVLSAKMTLDVLVCTNKAFEQSLQKSYELYEMQRNLWYPRWIPLHGKGICSACLHTFRTVKENATPFDIVKLPQNGILRTKLGGPFPHLCWSALWGKNDRRFLRNLPQILHGIWWILGWHSLDYLVLYIASLSLSWKKVYKSYCFVTFGPSLEVLKHNS